MSVRYSNKIVTDGLIFYLDAANPKSYTTGSLIWKDLIGGVEMRTYYAHRFSGAGFTLFPQFSLDAGGCFNFIPTGYGNPASGLQATASLSFPDTAITLESWVRRNSSTSDGDHPRVLELWDDLTNNETDTYDGHALQPESDGSLRSWVNQGPSTANSNRSNTNDTVTSYLTIGAWKHWVYTYDTANDKHYMYINGDLIFTYTQNMLAVRTTDRICIGNIGAWLINFNQVLDCSIALCRVYDKALSVDEIQKNFNAGRGRFGV